VRGQDITADAKTADKNVMYGQNLKIMLSTWYKAGKADERHGPLPALNKGAITVLNLNLKYFDSVRSNEWGVI
jgi:hypothetical protein